MHLDVSDTISINIQYSMTRKYMYACDSIYTQIKFNLSVPNWVSPL